MLGRIDRQPVTLQRLLDETSKKNDTDFLAGAVSETDKRAASKIGWIVPHYQKDIARDEEAAIASAALAEKIAAVETRVEQHLRSGTNDEVVDTQKKLDELDEAAGTNSDALFRLSEYTRKLIIAQGMHILGPDGMESRWDWSGRPANVLSVVTESHNAISSLLY